MLLGAACGDALGWPQEPRGGLVGGQRARDALTPDAQFRSWTRTAGNYRSRYRDPVRAGEYSDDTQLLLATARCCLHGDHWWEHLVEVELPVWLIYQRGGGGAVLRAAASWAARTPPWIAAGGRRGMATTEKYRAAGANGVAMRIAPHAVYASGPRDLVKRVIRDGLATHGHPRALVGAVAYAQALAHALRSEAVLGYGELLGVVENGLVRAADVVELLPHDWGSADQVEEFGDTWTATNKEMYELLAQIDKSLRRGSLSSPDETLTELGCRDPHISGAGTVSAAGALYLASRFAARPVTGVVTAAFLRGADTDTLASMTAGLLGALHGYEWLGEMASSVQDATYLGEISRALSTEPYQRPLPRVRPNPIVSRRLILEQLYSAEVGKQGEFPDQRLYRIVDVEQLERDRLRTRLHLNDGQTVVVDVRSDTADSRAATMRKSEVTDNRDVDKRSQLIEVTLLTRRIDAGVDFYAKLLDKDLPIRSDVLEVLPGLKIRQVRDSEPVGPLEITLAVCDPEAAVGRTGSPIIRASADDGSVATEDPDGRLIVLKPIPRDA
ncbi:ADP-ribosylglycohydrolase family protein [Nocardia abscessus]|uniref:ADP-ribosylglycohydrolase family protein n=1 Tax=Nocardia abscessus TaxID=120957 RepID=UPI001E5A859C|nr:ADP-ribosylglycohydrolase family protein [Nocardia abscessus]